MSTNRGMFIISQDEGRSQYGHASFSTAEEAHAYIAQLGYETQYGKGVAYVHEFSDHSNRPWECRHCKLPRGHVAHSTTETPELACAECGGMDGYGNPHASDCTETRKEALRQLERENREEWRARNRGQATEPPVDEDAACDLCGSVEGHGQYDCDSDYVAADDIRFAASEEETELYGSFLPTDGHVEEPAFLPTRATATDCVYIDTDMRSEMADDEFTAYVNRLTQRGN